MKSPRWMMSLFAGLLISHGYAEPVIIAHPQHDCKAGETIVWTGAMQAAFDRVLGSKSPKKLVSVTPPNSLIERMRSFQWDEAKVLPKGGWFAEAGPCTEQLIARANERWKQLAGPDAEPFELTPSQSPQSLAALVGIKRDFQFTKTFVASGEGRLQWGAQQTPVKYFGTKGHSSGEFSESVRVLSYRPRQHAFALQITAKQGDDTMVLYMPSSAQPMDEAIGWVKQWQSEWKSRKSDSMSWDDPGLHERDDLRVPEIALKKKEDFAKAFGGMLKLKGEGLLWVVTQALTSVALDVDAEGVRFSAKAEMAMVALAATPEPVPRRFIFDRPFFLFLWRDGAPHPYAAVWFGNAEAFVK